MEYLDYINEASSEKLVLAQIFPAQRLMVWELHSGSIYKKSVDFFVHAIEEEGEPLTQVTSLVAINSAGKWFFDDVEKILYVRTTDSVDPATVFTVCFYKMFFSNAPVTLPHDLDTGREVEYFPLIDATSEFGAQLENDEQVGTALEGQGNIVLQANDGYFENIYDKLFWENKEIVIYSWSRLVPVNEAQIIYEGLIESKSYNPFQVTFGLKDFISQLRDAVELGKYDGSEGEIPDATIGKFKRRIYGRVSGLKPQGIDMILDGYQLTGTLSGSVGSTVILGSGTLFFDEVSKDDEIYFFDTLGREQKFTVYGINNDTNLEVGGAVDMNFNGVTFYNRPKIPWRGKNREFLVAGHALRQPTTTVVTGISPNRFTVADPTDFEKDSFILVDGIRRQIKRVSYDLIVLRQGLPSTPSPGASVVRPPINSVHFGVKQFSAQTDYTVSNTSVQTTLILDDLAEFNITPEAGTTGTLHFQNNSRVILGTGTLFTQEFRVRDWVRSENQAEWYEIMAIFGDDQMHIRVPISTITESVGAMRKNVDYVGDESLITIDALGKTFNGDPEGEFIRTGPDVVQDLLTDAGLGDRLNLDSFEQADKDAPYLISLAIPLQPDSDEALTYRDVIDFVNRSVFGSVHKNKDFEIVYNVLYPRKPSSAVVIRDDDIISWTVQSDSKNIAEKSVGFYRPQDADRNTGEPAWKVNEKTSVLVQRLVKSKKIIERELYVYEDSDADTLTERVSFFNEISTSILKIRTTLNLSNKNIGDVVYFKLDRLYERFGTAVDRNKIGVISGVFTNGLETDIEVDDLSGFYLTVANIAPNDANIYTDADEDERAFNGYIVNNDDELIDPYEHSYRANSRIG